MSINKQSSVEKMFQEMLGIQQEGIKLTFDENLDLLEKYKAMHNEEIINAVVWFDDTDRRPHEIEIEVKQYYNQTYGGNK